MKCYAMLFDSGLLLGGHDGFDQYDEGVSSFGIKEFQW